MSHIQKIQIVVTRNISIRTGTDWGRTYPLNLQCSDAFDHIPAVLEITLRKYETFQTHSHWAWRVSLFQLMDRTYKHKNVRSTWYDTHV